MTKIIPRRFGTPLSSRVGHSSRQQTLCRVTRYQLPLVSCATQHRSRTPDRGNEHIQLPGVMSAIERSEVKHPMQTAVSDAAESATNCINMSFVHYMVLNSGQHRSSSNIKRPRFRG